MKLFVEEAKKYKSAEEFVKAQKPFYHGTTSKFTKFQPIETFRRDVDTGGTIKVKPPAVFLAEDKNVAKFFARDKVKIDQRLKGIKTSKPIVMKVYVVPKKTLDLTITPEVYEKFPNWMNQMDLNPITSQIFEKFGYEPMDFVDIHIALDDKSVIQGLKDMEYDSVLLREQSGAKALAVLSPKDVLTKQQLIGIYKKAHAKSTISKELEQVAKDYLDNYDISKPVANSLAKLDKLGLIKNVEGGTGKTALTPFSVKLKGNSYIARVTELHKFANEQWEKAIAKPPVEKQAWQMTKDEFTEKWIESSNCFGLVPDGKGILKEKAIKEAPIIHKEHIQKALKEGKSVPKEVLAEYP